METIATILLFILYIHVDRHAYNKMLSIQQLLPFGIFPPPPPSPPVFITFFIRSILHPLYILGYLVIQFLSVLIII